MRKERILMILGIWVAVLPYLGFPLSWKNIFFTLSGIAIVYYTFKLFNAPKKETTRIEIREEFYETDDGSSQ